ncbi:LSU ribosomal protein L25p [[Actinomadura] parvosata subsp. kistnae]|uniref:Large ribosomal subunit protein bL25 n=1 Tax=[Actinomadura] parvosata subsp. kistnae TaxID=1909395 RepID=A0A1V0AEQ4_9ACTN|nr:50S ribosomal protein L25/general stress protein Ctc [Nonomuraea sp. ATCC 55076]AQZ68685.1 50S ribosomal protein L25/general stress protein Ctc [Nonomuraea sp. ATCC 55076]SPL92831.1 LSU ribosomal protein L25p [Actinomadura parvosata subsp. kistnae]
MSEVRIAAEPRTAFGKGAARKIRRADKVPAVLYGHGIDPKHLTLPGHEVLLALRTPNVLIHLKGEGVDELALPKGVQRDPIKGFVEHVDLLLVKRGEKVTVEIPVTTVGDVNSEGLLDQQLVSIAVEAEATHIPTGVEVNVEGLEIGTVITAAQLELPKGATLAADPEAVVLHVINKPVEEPTGEEAEEAAAAGESAEAGEGESAEAPAAE